MLLHAGYADPLGTDVALKRCSEVLDNGRHEAYPSILNGNQTGEIQEFAEVFWGIHFSYVMV